MNERNGKSYNGFSLLEIMVAIFILGIAIAPMVKAYTPALLSTTGKEEMVVFSNQVRGTMHRILALDYATLDDNQGDPVDLETLFGSAEEAAKETFSLNGETYAPTVVIADASGGAGGLLEITVTMDPVTLKTLKAQY